MANSSVWCPFNGSICAHIFNSGVLLIPLIFEKRSVGKILCEHGTKSATPGDSYAYATELGTKNILPVAGTAHKPFVGYGDSRSKREIFSRNDK